MRILHVTFDMGIGGAEQVVRQLVISGKSKQIQHSVLCIDGRIGPFGEELATLGVKVDALERRPGFDWHLLKSLRAHLRKHEIDVVHCHQYTPFTYGRLAAIGLSIRVIFTEHGRFFPDVYSWKRRLLNQILTRGVTVTAISNATRNALHHYEWIHRSKVVVVYNGLQPVSVPSSDVAELLHQLGLQGKLVFGTVARLDPIKNHELMLRAFADFLKKGLNASLLIVGDGPERARNESLVKELNLIDHVIHAGFQSDPAAYFELIDVFLLPSLSEGTSMTLLQALATGRPSIVSDAGGNPEIVRHEVSGLVFPSGSLQELTSAMLQLAEATVRSRLGQGALEEFSNRFQVAQMIDAYVDLYRNTSRLKQNGA